MRYQERIYIQNQNSAVRNRNFNNFNMSSDMCVFNNPLYNISGATKIDCTGSTVTGATYIISANTQTIPLTFDFTANTQTFIDTNANFRYQIYKYENILDIFNGIPVYKSETLQYSAFSATNTTTQYIPSSGVTIDGDYMIKGFYQFSACTDFLKRLGKGVDTINYIYGDQYGIYDKNLDYYFVAIKQAEIPNFVNNGTNDSASNTLTQSVILPASGIQYIPKPPNIGNFILTLNGLVLANDLDYSYSGDVVTLNGLTADDDIITFIYTSAGGPNLISDNIDIATSIVSGSSNNQGSNLAYFNTTSGKYEIYTSVTPSQLNDIIVMLNGVTLANNIDFYQSTTNTKRIILEGDIFVGDIITIVYFPANSTVNGLNTNTPIVSWSITELPQKDNGYFSLEVSTANTFTNFYYSGNSIYNTSSVFYSDSFIATGTVGTTLYYRVKNQKNYETLCGDIVTTIAYSDIIPVVIQSNAINSY
jgi:hypothetical protein